MPPSGFSTGAVRGAINLIAACFDDLSKEVTSGKYSSYEEAVRIELQQVKHAILVDRGNSTEPLIGALKFVESCYADLSKREISDQSSYQVATTAQLKSLKRSLLACHIEKGILV